MATLTRVWWRIYCGALRHTIPKDWTEQDGRWARCARCGTRFNAWEQDRGDADMQTW